jgi:hypothetical protein
MKSEMAILQEKIASLETKLNTRYDEGPRGESPAPLQ